MRTIEKGAEPESLTRYRSGQSSEVTHSYNDFAEKQDLRDSLCLEQRGICCYCMGRIRPDADSMKIEHWRSQSEFPEKQLDYTNLLGACLGGEGQPSRLQHCDTRKGNLTIRVNPAKPRSGLEDRLKYSPDGRIDSDEPELRQELNEVLNLNLPFLRNNRRRVLAAFQKTLGKGNLNQTRIKKCLAQWNGESEPGNLPEYCQVIIYWLQKRLRRL